MDLNPIPLEVNYIPFDLTEIPPEITSSDDLRRHVLLQTQGETVILIESPKIALSMFIFNILHSVCPEVVFQTKTNTKYSIYNHQSSLAIRSKDIVDTLSIKEDFNADEERQTENDINIEDIWNSTKGNSEEERNLNSLNLVKKSIYKTHKTTVTGNVSLLLLLGVQHLIGNNTKQLYYKKSTKSEAKRIK